MNNDNKLLKLISRLHTPIKEKKNKEIQQFKKVCEYMLLINALNHRNIDIDKYITVVNRVIPGIKEKINEKVLVEINKGTKEPLDELKNTLAKITTMTWIRDNSHLCKQYKEYEKEMKNSNSTSSVDSNSTM